MTYLISTGPNTPPLITEEGVQVILDSLKLPVPAKALSSLQELAKELSQGIESSRGFVVRHSDNPLQVGSYHMTPVFIQKRERDVKVIVLDSKGAEKAHYAFFVAKKISECLNTRPHLLKTMRQPCSYRCAAYSILDLVELSKRAAIFDEIEVTKQSQTGLYFSSLPPSYPDMSIIAPREYDNYVAFLKNYKI